MADFLIGDATTSVAKSDLTCEEVMLEIEARRQVAFHTLFLVPSVSIALSLGNLSTKSHPFACEIAQVTPLESQQDYWLFTYVESNGTTSSAVVPCEDGEDTYVEAFVYGGVGGVLRSACLTEAQMLEILKQYLADYHQRPFVSSVLYSTAFLSHHDFHAATRKK